MEISILIPEHCRPLRLKQVVRNIRETSRYEHEIIVVGGRLDMGIIYDYPPELVDKEHVEYIKERKLVTQPPCPNWDYTVQDCLKCKNLFSMRDWLRLNSDYLRKYRVVVQECPPDYKIEERWCFKHDALPKEKKFLKDLREWDCACAVVLNWIVEKGDFSNDYIMITDDDMVFLKDWDFELLKHIDEEKKYDMVYSPRVFNVRRAAPSEREALLETFGAIQIVTPQTHVYLDMDYVRKLAEETDRRKPDFIVEPCGLREFGAIFPVVMHKRIYRMIGGRCYLISRKDDGTAPGRFVGGDEVHFDNKLADYGIKKKVAFKSVCIHTKLPLKFSD